MFKGEFKTAWMQRELPENAVVVGDLEVGELVKITPAAGEVPAIVEKLSAETAAEAIEEADAIMAQSDMTLSYNGHVPVELRDYKYSNEIAGTVDGSKLLPAVGATGASYIGYFAAEALLPETATNGDTALVYDSDDKLLVKYVYTSSADTPWAAATSTAAYEVALADSIKFIATFSILNRKHDVIVYDGE